MRSGEPSFYLLNDSVSVFVSKLPRPQRLWGRSGCCGRLRQLNFPTRVLLWCRQAWAAVGGGHHSSCVSLAGQQRFSLAALIPGNHMTCAGGGASLNVPWPHSGIEYFWQLSLCWPETLRCEKKTKKQSVWFESVSFNSLNAGNPTSWISSAMTQCDDPLLWFNVSLPTRKKTASLCWSWTDARYIAGMFLESSAMWNLQNKSTYVETVAFNLNY